MKNLSVPNILITLSLYLAIGPLPLAAQTCSSTQIGGLVYRDYDADAARDTYEPGVAGVTVSAYNAAGTLITSGATASDGTWTLSGMTAGASIRVEFSGLPSALLSGPAGSGSSSSVAFLTGPGSCAVSYGVNNPAQYCQSNPYVVSPRHVNGDPLGAGTAATQNALLAFEFDEDGRPANSTATAPLDLATNASIGATWGVAYQRSTESVFTSALMKRHAGFGPLGTGGIYKIDVSTINAPVVSNFIDVTTIGIATGADTHVGLPPDILTQNRDSAAFDSVGKIGIGDMDISDDEEYLYFINLADRTLYRLFIDNPARAPSVADVTSYPIADPGCSDDDFRPWAIKVHDGQVYIGIVCTAETSQDPADLALYVQRLSNAGTFTTLFTAPLNYTKGYPISPAGTVKPLVSDWQPWVATANDLFTATGVIVNGDFITYPQPILSDIEFDVDGSLVLALLDRTSHQWGRLNFTPLPFNMAFITSPPGGGDILRACPNGTDSWTLESNGGCGSLTSAGGVANNQGPGGGEFYYQEFISSAGTELHRETGNGALALLPGSNLVAATVYDTHELETNGVSFFSSSDGSRSRRYEAVPDFFGNFGKAAGMGDLELLCDTAPIQIGNRVWLDSDSDGIQDAGESGIASVTVTLTIAATSAVVATTTTDSVGTYLFSGLLPATAYRVCLSREADYLTGGALAPYLLTTANQGESQRDSDGTLTDSRACVSVTTGVAGANNHTYDFGFYSPCTGSDTNLPSLDLDRTATSLRTLVRQAVKQRRLARNRGFCPGLPVGKELLLRNRAQSDYLAVWNLAYSFEPVNYTCTTSHALCTTTDFSPTYAEIELRLRRLKRSVHQLLGRSCIPFGRRLKSQASSKLQEGLTVLNRLPASQTGCAF